MCYKFPGPRCSSHALADLKNKKEAFAVVKNDPTESFEAYHEFREAQKTFWSTPAGQSLLKEKIAKETDFEKEHKLREQLETSIRERQTALQAYKATFPTSLLEKEDLESETPVFTEEDEANADRLRNLTTGVQPGQKNPNFEEVRSLLQKSPHLYALAVQRDSNLSADEKFTLAKEHDDVVGVVHNMSYSHARQHPEELYAATDRLRAAYNADTDNEVVREAYNQATYVMANTADTEEKVEKAVEHFPHELPSQYAFQTLVYNTSNDGKDGAMNRRQTLKFLTDSLEKGSNLSNFTHARRVLAGTQSDVFRGIPPVTGRVPIEGAPNPADVALVNNPKMALSKKPGDLVKVLTAQGRIDATPAGWEKLQGYLRSSQSSDEPSMVRMYQERERHAIAYQISWWEMHHAKKNADAS